MSADQFNTEQTSDPLGEERRKLISRAETEASQRSTAFRSLLAMSGVDALELAMLMKASIIEAAVSAELPIAEVAVYSQTALRLQREGRRLFQLEQFLGQLDLADGAKPIKRIP